MAFFDKLFGGKKDNIIASHGRMAGVVVFNHEDEEGIEIIPQHLDPSKEIRKEVWDGLTESARNELKNKGYYCEGDDTDEHIVFIDP